MTAHTDEGSLKLADYIETSWPALINDGEKKMIVDALRAAVSRPEVRSEDARETIARALYECEKRRATNADAVIKGAFPNASDALKMEPWDECKDVFLSDAEAVLAVLPRLAHASPGALAAYKESVPDDLRFMGWAVAVHNDYRVNGVQHTFWLFTKGDRAVKGEGETDGEALNIVRDQVHGYSVPSADGGGK